MGKRSCKVLVVDTETTGLSSKSDSIIEIGMCVVNFDGRKFQGLGNTLESFIDPECSIPTQATEINHITNDMVKGKPTYLDQSLRSQVNRLCEECDYITAHNLPFDMRFLMVYSDGFEKFTQNKQICTLRAARWTWPTLERHKLSTLRIDLLEDEIKGLSKYHPLFESLQDHRALSDVFIDIALLKMILDQGALGTKSWNGFIRKTQEPTPVNKINFGKYRGFLLVEVVKKDPLYCKWLLEQDWFKKKRVDLASQIRSLLRM